MNLNKREKILLIALGAVLLIFGYYKFIFTPQQVKIKELKAKIEELENVSRIAKLQASSKNNIYREFKVTNSKVSLITKRFYSTIIQEKLVLRLDEIIKDTKFDISSMSFTKPEKAFLEKKKEEENEKDVLEEYINTYKELSQASPLKRKDEAEDEEETEEGEADKEDELKEKVEKMTAALTFEDDYERVISFIGEIEALNRNVVIDRLSLVKNEEGNELKGSIVLDYYALPKLNEEDSEYLKWDIEAMYGTDNPFTAFAGYSSSDVAIDNNERQASSSVDFNLGVHPIAADIPTVIIGKAKDYEGNTYAYGDNPNFEAVEFQIIKENEKYYYKYKTEMEGYPKNYENSMVEFNPIDNKVVLSIMSSKRKDAEDKSGINLTLINKSDLTIEVNIKNDDPQYPRVRIADKIGDVILK